MASKGYIERNKRQVEQQQIDQQERASKRKFVGDIIGSAIGGAGRVISAGIKNDVSWYLQWLKDPKPFTNLPTYENSTYLHLGKGISYKANGQARKLFNGNGVVLSLRYINHIGVVTGSAGGATHPINEAMTSTLAQLAKVNSRAVSADPDVLGLYMLSVTELGMYLSWLKTNVEIVGYFEPEQAYIRDAILSARGANVDLFVNNVAELKKLYALYAARFNTELPIPADLSYVKRKIWVACSLIRDEDLNKGSYITFCPNRFGKLSEDNDKFVWDQHRPQSLLEINNYLREMFRIISLDVDFQTIIGNMRAAVPEAKFAKLPEVVGDYVSVIKANDEVLMQLHNLRTLPLGLGSYFDIMSDNMYNLCTAATDENGEYLTQGTTVTINNTMMTDHGSFLAYHAMAARDFNGVHTLDFYKQDVKAEDMLVATRLHPIYTVKVLKENNTDAVRVTDAHHGEISISSCGTEIVVDATIYAFNANFKTYSNKTIVHNEPYIYNTIASFMATPTSMINNLEDARTALELEAVLDLASTFDWRFPIYKSGVNYSAEESFPGVFTSVNCQFGNVFSVQANDLDKIHWFCDKSLYYLDTAQFKA